MTLQTSTISKRYGNHWVLRDVSLDLEQGRVLGLLGARGAGKTTLLKILAGVEDSSPKRSTGLGAARAVIFPRRDRSFFDRLFDKPSENQDHEALMHSMNGSADVVLLDDPLVTFDTVERSRILDEIRDDAKEKNLAVVYATNDFETVAIVASTVAVLDRGVIQQTGTAAEIYETPVSRAVANVSGLCNIIDARRLTSTKNETPEFQTLIGSHRLFAEKADVAKLGAINRNVGLAIRPENISISFGASFPEDNLIKAVVTGIKYLGASTLVDLDSEGLKLTARVFRVVGLGIGDECMLGLPPDRIRILKD